MSSDVFFCVSYILSWSVLPPCLPAHSAGAVLLPDAALQALSHMNLPLRSLPPQHPPVRIVPVGDVHFFLFSMLTQSETIYCFDSKRKVVLFCYLMNGFLNSFCHCVIISSDKSKVICKLKNALM